MLTGKLIPWDDKCHKCGNDTAWICRRGPHMRITCSKCSAFQKFIEKKEARELFDVTIHDLDDLNKSEEPISVDKRLNRIESTLDELHVKLTAILQNVTQIYDALYTPSPEDMGAPPKEDIDLPF